MVSRESIWAVVRPDMAQVTPSDCKNSINRKQSTRYNLKASNFKVCDDIFRDGAVPVMITDAERRSMPLGGDRGVWPTRSNLLRC
jgi:hypothetical protein